MISCCAPSIVTSEAARMRRARCSSAGVDTTSSAPAAMISVGMLNAAEKILIQHLVDGHAGRMHPCNRRPAQRQLRFGVYDRLIARVAHQIRGQLVACKWRPPGRTRAAEIYREPSPSRHWPDRSAAAACRSRTVCPTSSMNGAHNTIRRTPIEQPRSGKQRNQPAHRMGENKTGLGSRAARSRS
jgi:hypothetical protein